jgi:hypothetical protein
MQAAKLLLLLLWKLLLLAPSSCRLLLAGSNWGSPTEQP